MSRNQSTGSRLATLGALAALVFPSCRNDLSDETANVAARVVRPELSEVAEIVALMYRQATGAGTAGQEMFREIHTIEGREKILTERLPALMEAHKRLGEALNRFEGSIVRMDGEKESRELKKKR